MPRMLLGLRGALCLECQLGRAGLAVPWELVGWRGVGMEAEWAPICLMGPLNFLSETGDVYIWGWNESGQLALPTRSLAEDGKTVAGEGEG